MSPSLVHGLMAQTPQPAPSSSAVFSSSYSGIGLPAEARRDLPRCGRMGGCRLRQRAFLARVRERACGETGARGEKGNGDECAVSLV
eukprot:scaffold257331_cov27-Tisochrysis_lutea.AAC.1